MRAGSASVTISSSQLRSRTIFSQEMSATSPSSNEAAMSSSNASTGILTT